MTKKIITLILFLVLTITAISSLSCIRTGVLVHIQNKSNSELKNIVIEFTGGKEILLKLQPSEELTRKIKPIGESSLTITYSSGKNNYESKSDTYIEPSSKGHLYIIIEDEGKVVVLSEIGL